MCVRECVCVFALCLVCHPDEGKQPGQTEEGEKLRQREGETEEGGAATAAFAC